MRTYYLKATDEDTLWESLEAAGLAFKNFDENDANNQRPDDLGEEEVWEPSGEFEWATREQLDVIGLIYVESGTDVDNDGNQIPTLEPLEGFHANLRAGLDAAQKAALPIMQKTPKNPVRKWAGDE